MTGKLLPGVGHPDLWRLTLSASEMGQGHWHWAVPGVLDGARGPLAP